MKMLYNILTNQKKKKKNIVKTYQKLVKHYLKKQSDKRERRENHVDFDA